MKKTIRGCALCMVLCMLLLLTGCHGNNGMAAFNVPSSLDTTSAYEITFWAKNDTNKTQTAIYQQAIDEFEALYPNVTVNLRLYTDYSKIYNDVITNIATNTTPNVCITYPDHIATYLSGQNTVVALDTLMTDEKFGLGGSEVAFDAPTASEIVPQFLSECYIGEHCYALPFMRSTEACYINKTYVEKLGYTVPDVLTWDFIWEVSEAALAKNEDGTYAVNGQKVMIPFIYKSTDNMMIQMLRQLNAGYSTSSGEILLFNDTTRSLLYTIADHVRTGAFSTFKISSYPGNFLNAGQCIFAIDSTAGATWMGSKAPLMDISAENVVEFETVVRAIPQFDTSNPQMISQGPSVCIFNKSNTQEVLYSWLFTQYLLTDDIQLAYSETEGYVPVTLKAQNSAAYQDYLNRCGEDDTTHYNVKISASKLLLDNTQNTFTTPVFNGSASLRDAAGQLIESVAKSTRRKQAVNDETIAKLYSETAALYHLDQSSTADNALSADRSDLGELPSGSKALLITLCIVWVLMIIYVLLQAAKQKKK